MEKHKNLAVLLYTVVLFGLTIYSYVLVDPNLTLVNHPLWTQLRNTAVIIGYYNRTLSYNIYLILTLLLLMLHILFNKSYKHYNPIKIGIITAVILLFSYPFLSHDFFNYLFDAKIITTYGQNPYMKTALDFPTDSWIRFMHWTHRTYPYGPTFLPLTLIPSFISFNKFILNFFLFKLLFSFFYLLSIYLLKKMNKAWALFFATNPLILIEGLVNAHNDFIAAAFAIVGIYYLSITVVKTSGVKYNLIGRTFLLLSGGIKYITLPTIILQKTSEKKSGLIAFLGVFGVIVYLSFFGEIQPWYFLNIFIFVPYFFRAIQKFQIFLFTLLISYYPYIYLGGWDSPEKITLKHNIILFGLLINICYLLYKNYSKKNSIFKQ